MPHSPLSAIREFYQTSLRSITLTIAADRFALGMIPTFSLELILRSFGRFSFDDGRHWVLYLVRHHPSCELSLSHLLRRNRRMLLLNLFPRFSSLVLLPVNLVTKPKSFLHKSLEKFQSRPRCQITTALIFPEARPLRCGWGRFAIPLNQQEPHKLTQYTSRNPRLGIPDIPPRAFHRGTSLMQRVLIWLRPRCLLLWRITIPRKINRNRNIDMIVRRRQHPGRRLVGDQMTLYGNARTILRHTLQGGGIRTARLYIIVIGASLPPFLGVFLSRKKDIGQLIMSGKRGLHSCILM